ncbi:MAG TPA: hypothetical protein VM782_01810, partial [Stellaceae bacterium]|nr:hypothetical protein [Stellaceae bacterium]
MPAASMPDGPAYRSRGFALLIVLWMLVLIGFIIAHVTATARSEAQIASNIAASAAASAAADGAVYRTIFSLVDGALGPDGTWRETRFGRSLIATRVDDESGRINPNLASAALLEGLLRAAGNSPETATELADAITQWVGTANRLRSADELAAEYRAAGLNYAPPETPLESIDELLRVRGMTQQELDILRPHLSLFAGRDPNAATAD